jgi:hypothetical protein
MQIEKSVFISYRRTNSYHALAIFQDLRTNGYIRCEIHQKKRGR